MWSMDYVQVPDERAETPVNEIQEIVFKKESEEEIKEKKKAAIVKQMSLTTEDNGEHSFIHHRC